MRSERNQSEPSGRQRGSDTDSPRTAGHQGLLAGDQVAGAQLDVVPRHRRVVPLQPGQRHAVRVQPRRGHEVRAADQHLRLGQPVARPAARSRCARRSRRRAGVPLPDADDRRRVRVEVAVGVPVGARRGRLGRDRLRRAAGVQPVQPLVGPVGEPGDAVAHPPAAAAVLVHRGARVPIGGQQLDRVPSGSSRTSWVRPPSAGRPSDQTTAAPSDLDLGQPHRGRHHQLGGDRGGPGAESQRGHAP